MNALQWIYVAMIGLSIFAVACLIAAIDKPVKAVTRQRAVIQLLMTCAYVVLYICTIRALS